jgi:RND superfamily putative drug exporter
VVAAWLALALAMLIFVPPAKQSDELEKQFLPPDSTYLRALNLLQEAFPGSSGFSEAIIVFERSDGPLTADDLAAIEKVADKIRTEPTAGATREDLDLLAVRSPGSIPSPRLPVLQTPLFRNPLLSKVSEKGQATIVTVNIPSNYITLFSAKIVDHVRTTLRKAEMPDGLSAAVTGSAGFGHGYAQAAEASSRRTTWVTLVAVVVILLLVYRAPLGAFVPLASISIAAVVVVQLLQLLQPLGLHAGTAEKIFVFVLMYGAGIDYSLLLISRFREELGVNRVARQATANAVDATLAPITASALTDALGMLMLVFAGFLIFRSTGPVVAVALVVAMLASLTLVPAMVAIFGRRITWPGRRRLRTGPPKIWSRLARIVVSRPGRILAVTILVLVLPAWRGLNIQWAFDSLSGFKPTAPGGVGNASAGVLMARRHWPVGEVAPTTLLIHSPRPLGLIQWSGISQKVTRTLSGMDGVANVRSYNVPLGKRVGPWSNALLQTVGGSMVASHYVSQDQRTARVSVILADEPMSPPAMATVERIVPRIRTELGQAEQALDVDLQLLSAGATSETIAIRDTTRSDARLVAALALSVIFFTVLALLRDPILSAFMICSTVISYLATLGICAWLLVDLMGADGLDWKIEILLFVVMVAVGVDYNIFLASRMSQEARRNGPKKAIELAVIHTGPVISSCGVIMAASLGSLMAGQLQLLSQLGFALALGMMMDTFVIRPLLLPAFASLTGRTGKAPR